VEVACVPVAAIGGLTLQGTGTLGHRAAAAGGELFDTGLCSTVRSNHRPMADASHGPAFHGNVVSCALLLSIKFSSSASFVARVAGSIRTLIDSEPVIVSVPGGL